MTTNVVNLNEKEFQSLSDKGVTFAVRLWAEWCAPCRMMSPIYRQVAEAIANDDLVMAELNIDEHPAIAERLGVRSIPTVVIFKDGKEVNRSVGMLPTPELQKLITRYA
ncbi:MULTISPECIES: co-chaperone YbbN [unclassified Cobetia]|uniref:thioredoxin family protein n=1 Tax=unclassified Cobetia TaxID=2609414 RepID=UPI002096B434|nr:MULTISPECIES: thioredoxin family protein [unclassified Cobetia]MCO7233544.1 thioredoxin family protein [Cobetia sp. Dlab-2-AX]MCO7236820.1 thioredoxin family protein [Cobetia sp. Dlab-2-U]